MYQILKDFAGPVATLIASVTAALITFYFASRQVQVARQQAAVARQQADTALDQLRYNLSKQRYAIFKDVQDFIRLLVNKPAKETFGPMEVSPHFIVMDEARFFFSDDICSWLDELRVDCRNFLGAHDDSNVPPLETHAKMMALVNRATEMSKRFEKELEFRQLIRRAPIAHLPTD
jgi:type II secretory pathway pseudopilin PulG